MARPSHLWRAFAGALWPYFRPDWGRLNEYVQRINGDHGSTR